MTLLFRPLLGAALFALLPAAALAQAAAPSAPATAESKDGRSASPRLAVCRADVAKHCADVARGGRRACLKSNEAKLSPECAAAFADVEAKDKAMREACAEDVKTHCAAVGKGKGGRGIVQCLQSNAAKLSSACNAAISARFGG